MSRNINIANSENKTLDSLYRAADVVLCDYGGSIFSALYCSKPVILLNDRDHNEYFRGKRLGDMNNLIRRELINLSQIKNQEVTINSNKMRISECLNSMSSRACIENKSNSARGKYYEKMWVKSAKRTATEIRRICNEI